MAIKRFIAANGLDGNNKTITNVTDPTAAQDVSTKAYSTNATNLASGTVDPARIANVIAAGASGLMTGSDKTKLDGVASGATANTGTVTTVSVVSANGLAGTVATAGTTPAITLSTTINGLLKGNGTAISAATAGTDYVSPQTTLAGYGITDAYTKTEVDGLVQGLDPKASVKAASIATLTLSGAQTVDSISLVAGDRVLVKNQTTTSQNGIYLVASGAWTRAVDMNAWTEVPSAYVFVEQGTTNADMGYVCTSDAGGTLDTTAITWVLFTSAASASISVTGGDLTLSGTTGTAITNATLAAVGTTGTYRSVTTDSKGRVTAGTNPTTLAGYGITDALGNTQALANALIPLTYGDIASVTLTTSATTANQVLDSNPVASYRSISYLVQVTSSTSYHSCNINVIHDGVSLAYYTEFADMFTGASLSLFDVDISAGNVRLLVTPTNAVTTYKVIKTMIDV